MTPEMYAHFRTTLLSLLRAYRERQDNAAVKAGQKALATARRVYRETPRNRLFPGFDRQPIVYPR